VLIQEAATDPCIPLVTTIPPHGSEKACLAFITRQRTAAERVCCTIW
jgi:hypothetical protein